MYKIEVYIRPASLELVSDVFKKAGVKGISFWKTHGLGYEWENSQKTPEMFRGAVVKNEYIERLRIDTIIEEKQKDDVIKMLKELSNKGDFGNIRIFVMPVGESIRISKDS
jgi:nitrogen regulatory protein P-II 1